LDTKKNTAVVFFFLRDLEILAPWENSLGAFPHGSGQPASLLRVALRFAKVIAPLLFS